MVGDGATVDDVDMSKRIVSATLWFIAVWSLVELIETFVGLPRAFGPVVGAAIGVFAYADPLGLFWTSARRTRRVGAIADRVTVPSVQ